MIDWSSCLLMIEQSEKIAVLPHISADGDALGSAFSLALAITARGKKAAVILEETPEKRLEFILPSVGPEIVISPVKCGDPYDMAIAVDCADRLRLGSRADVFFSAQRQVKIDHHVEKDPFGQINFVKQRWAATCEGIWELLCEVPFELENNLKNNKNQNTFYLELAKCLYCGIASDTGSFAYSNTTSETHLIASCLVAFIGDISDIHFRLFKSNSRAAVSLKATAYRKITYGAAETVAFLELNEEDFIKSGAMYDDANELVSLLRGIEGVELAVFARPKRNNDGGIKISLRSNQSYDAAALAAAFNGGGHKRAAGFDFSGTFNEVQEKIIKYIEAERS